MHLADEKRMVKIVKWMYKVFTTRIAVTSMDDESVFVKATRGTPHSAVIFRLFWNLVMFEPLQRLTKLDFECVGYSDDIVQIITGKFEGTLCGLL